MAGTSTPDVWRKRAHLLRARARQISDSEERKALLAAADEYDRIAALLEKQDQRDQP